MKCPLPFVYRSQPSAIVEAELRKCIKEECAWFHPTTQSCEVSRIASNLSTIANYLDALVDKMPTGKVQR